jgi:hypothetical protein
MRVRRELRQPKVNDFDCYDVPLLDTHHDVAWFDVPVNGASWPPFLAYLIFVHPHFLADRNQFWQMRLADASDRSILNSKE